VSDPCDELYILPPISSGQKFALIAFEERFTDGSVIPVTVLEATK
jgi:hypothetical protein